MFKKFSLFIVLLILLSNVSALDNITLQISEIYPNPPGKDNINLENREFIEIYNFGNKEINLDNFKILNSKNKSLVISSYFNLIRSKQYLIFYPMNKFSLKNSGQEEILLTYNDFIIDEFSYSYSQEGYSWTRLNNTWILAKPSLGKTNLAKTEIKKIKEKTKSNLKLPSYNKIYNKSEKLLNIVNNNTNSKIVYESKALKQSRLGLYLFLFTLTLVIISLLIEKWKINKSKQE